jgi:rod shape-determining protein MreD
MRNTAFLLLGFLVLIVQSTTFRLIDWLHPALATPSLLLPVVVFMGVHEYSIGRGAALSFVLGYMLDVFVAGPLGLFTFITAATFVIARFAGVRLAAQTLVTKVALAFVFALLEGVLVVVFTAIVGDDPFRARATATLVPAHAATTAACAPFVFALSERVHLATIASQTPQDASGRAAL